jgi:3-phenylpropionate/trans-cinnamate dioxygenase ferredoxin subunit
VTSLRVCSLEELPPGEKKIVRLERGISIGIFNVDGALYAIRNVCPHHGAQLCLGVARPGTMLPAAPGEWAYSTDTPIVRCPRHRWEFRLKDGRSFTTPDRYRVKVYDVSVIDGDVHLEA